jgi:DNA-binding MarR family transcriptional regulator
MDASTIKGVIDRLTGRGYTATRADPEDARRLLVELTEAGIALYSRAAQIAAAISAETLAPLAEGEREMLVALLRRLI